MGETSATAQGIPRRRGDQWLKKHRRERRERREREENNKNLCVLSVLSGGYSADVLSNQAQKFAGDEVAGKIKKLRSDAAFQRAFEQGMARALGRFVEEYREQDEDLVAAVTQDQDFFQNKEVQAALLAVLKRPGAYLDEERAIIDHSFTTVLPAPTKAIVTTRHRLDVAYPVRLHGMSWEEARQLIEHEAHKKNVRLTENQRRRLYQRAGGVPLAIVWSISQMGFGYKVATVLNRLSQPTNDMIRFCFAESLRRIKNRPAYKLLMALSLFVPDGSREALGFVAGLPELDRDDGLVDLEKLSLVNKDGDRFSFLPVTQTFASAELNRDSEQAQTYGRRWLEYFKQLYEQYYGSGNEYRLRYGNFAFLDDGPNMLEAIEWAYENGATGDIFVLTIAVSNYLDATGRWNTLLSLINRGLELARSSADVRALGRLGDVKAWLLEQRGELDEAESAISESLACYRQIKDEEAETVLLQRLSAIYRKRGDFAQAQTHVEAAYAIAERLQNGDLIALVDTQHGKLARDQQDWQRSWDLFRKVQQWFEQRTEQTPRDEELPAGTWGHMAIIAYHLGRPEEARDLCLRSLEFFERSGTKGYMATLKYRLALVEEALGNREEALSHVNEAIDWYQRLGMKPDLPAAVALREQLQHSVAEVS